MNRPASILVISSGALCRNPRVFKEATTLGNAGFDVTVLTLAESERFEAQDRALLAAAPFRKIVIGSDGDGRWPHLTRFLHRASTWAARKAVRLGLESPLALGAAPALARRARGLPADLTIVHNELPHCIGAQLLRSGRRVATDIEDWHSEDLLSSDRAARPLRLIRRTERTLLLQSRYCSTTSHALAEALKHRYGGPLATVITNSFPLQQSPRTAPGEIPAFFWFSQTIGPGRGLETFLDAWTRITQPSRCILLGSARQEFLDPLLARVPASRRRWIQIRPLVTPAELPSVIAEHDIGLALEPRQPANKDLTISNKILQYLNAGLAVVASNTAGQREVITDAPGAGVLVELDDTAALTATLERLLSEREQIAAMQRCARAAAEQRYCWEHEAPKLVTAVRAALASP